MIGSLIYNAIFIDLVYHVSNLKDLMCIFYDAKNNYNIAKIYLKLPVIFYDTTAIPVSWYSAYWLRYNLHSFSGARLLLTHLLHCFY